MPARRRTTPQRDKPPDAAALSTSIEDYIKAIYMLETEGRPATTKRIATLLGVRMASVTGMIKHLAAEGYVRYRPYRGVTLTETGKHVALRILRRHRIIELFLVQTLGLQWDEVHEDAEILEHAVSDRLIERIYEFLGRPRFDPHGAPIPTRDGRVRAQATTSLVEYPPGRRARIARVSDADPALLRFLTRQGLQIGTVVTVADREEFSGALTLRVGRRQIMISPEAARRIAVTPA